MVVKFAYRPAKIRVSIKPRFRVKPHLCGWITINLTAGSARAKRGEGIVANCEVYCNIPPFS